jgi:hypothetical protein
MAPDAYNTQGRLPTRRGGHVCPGQPRSAATKRARFYVLRGAVTSDRLGDRLVGSDIGRLKSLTTFVVLGSTSLQNAGVSQASLFIRILSLPSKQAFGA